MGRPPFLLSESNTQFVVAFGCQCPEWGDLHFYVLQEISYCLKSCLCQCPEWGDLHFYLRGISELHEGCYYCVNALNGATSISTGLEHSKELRKISCVNALNGATSISTRI